MRGIMFLVGVMVLQMNDLADATPAGEDQYAFWSCGQSEAQARHRAREKALVKAGDLEQICDEEDGEFSFRLRNGVCHLNDGDPSCLHECIVYMRTACESPAISSSFL